MKKHIGIFAENLSRTVDRHMLVSLWASIRDADKIGRSFLQARTAMRYRFIISDPAIISVADIDAHIEKNSAYPYVELTRLEQSMKKLEIGANFAAHEDFVKLIREGNFTLHQAKCICYDIVSLFVKTVDKMNITEAVE